MDLVGKEVARLDRRRMSGDKGEEKVTGVRNTAIGSETEENMHHNVNKQYTKKKRRIKKEHSKNCKGQTAGEKRSETKWI